MTLAAVFFDFDGVLADSEPLHLRVFQDVLADLGLDLAPEDYYARYLGYDDADAVRAMLRDRGLVMSLDEIDGVVRDKARRFDAALERADVLFPAATACVRRFAGRVALGIVSGALRVEIEAVLRRAGLLDAFRVIVAAGDTRAGKPAPDPYRLALDRLRCPATRSVAIEDSRWGIESAREAGLWCVGLATSYPAAELQGADLVISSLDELSPEALDALVEA